MLVRRLLPLAFAVGALGVATTGCADQAAAAKVGDATYSDKDFRDELADVAEDETLVAVFGFDETTVRGEEGSDSYSQTFVTLLLNQRVSGLMAQEILDNEDVEVTEDDLAATESQLTDELAQSGADFTTIEKVNRERLVALYATIDKARNGVDAEVVQREATKLGRGVKINSRYGTWDPDQGVIPPSGPLVSDGADEEAPLGELEVPSG